jgi:hypothetical protein
MRLDRLCYWHWIVIGLALATAASILRARLGEPAFSSYGEQINAPVDFETALLTLVGGEFQFHDLIVHTAADPTASAQPVYIVRGRYHDGRTETAGPVFRPAYFVSHVPYAPLTDLSRLSPPGGPDFARRYQQLTSPTVLDFLHILSQARGVRYRHAWWITHAQSVWFAATFIGVGVIWPIVMNLLLYGRLTRPREQLEPSAPQAHPSSAPPPRQHPERDADAAALSDVISHLESSPASPPSDEPAPQVTKPVSVSALQGGPLAAQVAAAQETKEFAADAEDYYPTERRPRK